MVSIANDQANKATALFLACYFGKIERKTSICTPWVDKIKFVRVRLSEKSASTLQQLWYDIFFRKGGGMDNVGHCTKLLWLTKNEQWVEWMILKPAWVHVPMPTAACCVLATTRVLFYRWLQSVRRLNDSIRKNPIQGLPLNVPRVWPQTRLAAN